MPFLNTRQHYTKKKMASSGEEVTGTPSNQGADLSHADPLTDDQQSKAVYEPPAVRDTEAPATTSNDRAVTVHEGGQPSQGELCQEQVKQGEDAQASQLSDDLCSTLLNGSAMDATLHDTTTLSKVSECTVESEQGSGASKLSEAEEPSNQWIDVLGNGQLLKKTVRPGEGPSSRPAPEHIVKIRVKGYLESGKVVDFSHPYKFIVGDGDVIQAWDLAVSLMEKREVALVKAHPRFAFGEIGKPPDIPPNATITFELELLDVHEPIDYSIATEDEILSNVNFKCSRGNDLFQKKDYERALNSYCKGRTMLERYLTEQHLEPTKAIKDIQVRCWNNLAAAALKMDENLEALKACQSVLECDPNNVKALYRRGKVASTMGDYDLAIDSFQKAISIDPDAKFIQAELQSVVKKKNKSIEDEKALYKRMIGTAKLDKPQSPSHKIKIPASDAWGPLPYLAVAASIAAVGIGIAYYFFQRH